MSTFVTGDPPKAATLTDVEVLYPVADSLKTTFGQHRDTLTETHGFTAAQHAAREQAMVNIANEAGLESEAAKYVYELVTERDVAAARGRELDDDQHQHQQQSWNKEGRRRLQAQYGEQWETRLAQFKRALEAQPKFKALGDDLGWPPDLLMLGVAHAVKHGLGGFR